MSHDATGWAIKQRGLKPATKIVLWQLCDRFHPDNGCFPSQETLSNDCEMSRSSLNEHLDALELAGLIRREQRRDGPTHRQKSTLYRFAFEDGFAALKPAENKGMPCPESGHGAVSEKTPEPCPENGESRVQNPDTNLVREPVKEPVEREREREPEDQKTVERWLKRVHPNWPSFVADSYRVALKQAMALTAAERETAADRMADYLAAEKASGGRCAFGVYLSEKRWERLGPKPEAPAKPTYAPSFGPVWAAMRMRDLVTGPKAQPAPLKGWELSAIENGRLTRETLEKDNRMRSGWPMVNGLHMGAERGVGISGYGEAEEELGKLCEFVPVDSDVWKAWKVEHDLRGWPWLPDPGSMRGVYFPVGGPGGLEAFEQAVRGTHDAQQAAE